MKNQSLLFLMMCMFVWGACNSFLEEPEPAQSLPSATAFTNAKDIETCLIGAYSSIQLAGFMGCNVILCSDILADNGVWKGSFPDFNQMFMHQMTAENMESGFMWRDAYRTINQANQVLQAIPKIIDPSLTKELADQYRGEALFLRAVAHFELVRYFAKPYDPDTDDSLGIPIITKATTFPEEVTYPPRNTVHEVYEMVLEDLDSALVLPQSTGDGRANYYTTIAYLAEVNFQMGHYMLAKEFAEQVLNGPYSLTPDPEEFFEDEGSEEEIWVIKHTDQDNPGRNASLPGYHHFNTGGIISVSEDLKANGFDKIITSSQAALMAQDSLIPIDLRLTKLMSNPIPAPINVNKYEDYVTNADDVPAQRLAEFVLMRAESLARLDSLDPVSIDLLNQIRIRSIRVLDTDSIPIKDYEDYIKYNTSDFKTGAELIEAIILERRVELCFEGNRFHDLCRLQRDVRDKSYTAEELRFPIPQREMDVNPNLKQNPGY